MTAPFDSGLVEAGVVCRWPGPFGGLPPFGEVASADLEAAVLAAIAARRREIAAIAANPAPPDFVNTVLALESGGRAIRNAESLLLAYSATASLADMPAIAASSRARLAAFEVEIAGDLDLFARLEDVHSSRDGLPAIDRRLTEVLHARFVRMGARLTGPDRQRLRDIDERLAELQSAFSENLLDSERRVAWVVDAAELDGLPATLVHNASDEADRRGRPCAWAFANTRIVAWSVLQSAANRNLRRRMRDMWVDRGVDDGPHDNRPVMAELVRLRGEKARLFGNPSFAHFQTAERMAGTPAAAMAQMRWMWDAVLARTQSDLDDMQALAAVGGIEGPLEPWDTRYYAEELRRRRFSLDAEEVRDHLSLANVLAMLMDVAERLHGITFVDLPNAPRLDPAIRVFELRRDGEALAVIWFDLLRREGKMAGAFQQQLRAAETFDVKVLPLSLVSASFEPAAAGTVLVGWELANVLFHEFGHALHMVLSRAPYRSLGPMGVPWDMIELPSQLHERWLLDPDLLRRHARHHITGQPIPGEMISGLEAVARHERATSLTLAYLAPAIVDLAVYSAADGGAVDPMAIEARTYADLGLPRAIDPIMRLPNQYHSSTDVYAAGIYVYLWADVMVADVLEAFLDAPGGLYDVDVAARWRDEILAGGAARDSGEAFRAFRGRDPDPKALLRRFDLV